MKDKGYTVFVCQRVNGTWPSKYVMGYLNESGELTGEGDEQAKVFPTLAEALEAVGSCQYEGLTVLRVEVKALKGA